VSELQVTAERRSGPGPAPPAGAGVGGERGRRHGLDVGRAFPVAQLAPVEVVGVWELGLGPAQVAVAGGLHHPLAADDPLPVVPVPARRQVVLEDRGGGLLELQDQRGRRAILL
jgi:hypothetical protein